LEHWGHAGMQSIKSTTIGLSHRANDHKTFLRRDHWWMMDSGGWISGHGTYGYENNLRRSHM